VSPPTKKTPPLATTSFWPAGRSIPAAPGGGGSAAAAAAVEVEAVEAEALVDVLGATGSTVAPSWSSTLGATVSPSSVAGCELQAPIQGGGS